MTDMTPIAGIALTPDRAKSLLEAAGARNVSIKTRKSGMLWAFFSYLGRGSVWGVRSGAQEKNFARDCMTLDQHRNPVNVD